LEEAIDLSGDRQILDLDHGHVWGSGGIAPAFLSSALDGGEWSASRPSRFNPKETGRRTHWIGG
jgi:hypothetical protein